MDERHVRTIDDIIFEDATPSVTLAKGSVYAVEAVLEDRIVLRTEGGERFMIDLTTFEDGFEAVL